MAAAVLVTPSEALAAAVEAELARRVAPHQARRADLDRARRSAVGDRPGRRPRRRARRSSTPTPPSTWRSRPGTPPPSPPGSRNAGAIFVGPWSPVSPRRLLRGLQPRAAHRRLRLPLQRARRAVLPARHPGRRVRRAALREVAPQVLALADAEDLPAHGEAVTARFGRGGVIRRWPAAHPAERASVEPARDRSDTGARARAFRCARSCGATSPTARRSSTSRSGSTPTRTPTGCPPRSPRRSSRRSRRWPRSSTATPTASSPGCARTSPATSGTGSPAEQIWAGNGSNEVLQHVLQAFGGPGPDGDELHAHVRDVPAVLPRHEHRLGRRPARRHSPPAATRSR